MWTYQPDTVSAPGATLLETLEAIGMTQAELAERTGRPKKTINEIVKGKTAITPETALQFEKVLGIPARFWNNREAAFRDFLARQEERKQLQEEITCLRNIPIAALERLKWIPRATQRVDRLRNAFSFYGVVSCDALEGEVSQALFRCSPALKADRFALAAWLRKGWLEAQQIDTPPFSETLFRKTLTRIREWTGALAAQNRRAIQVDSLIQSLQEMCSPAGVAVVFVTELPRTRAFGATRWISPVKPLIQLSNRYRRDDIFWFTFFHEAAHVLKHGKKETFIECDGAKDDKEAAADRFAADFLIPPDNWQQFVAFRPREEAEVREFARRLKISPGIVVGRLQHENLLAQNHLNKLKLIIQAGGKMQEARAPSAA